MEFLPELKKDNALLGEFISERVGQIYDEEIMPVHSGTYIDRHILEEYLARPGRGIGGSLVLRLSQLYEPAEYTKEAISIAAATEVMNAYFLIIDDWIDGSATRKGQPTAHEHYREYIFNRHIAERQAVQLGTAAAYIANLIALTYEFPGQTKILENIHRGALRVCTGNMLEGRLAADIALRSYDNIDSVYENKTGYYSFRTPMTSGLLLAGADQPTIDKFSEAALKLGMGFQYQDDLMGIFGDPEITGKPNIDDIQEGLYTVLYDTAIHRLRDKDKIAELERLHGKPNITPAEAETFREIIRFTGADRLIKANAEMYLKWGYGLIAENWSDDWNPEVLIYLRTMTKYLESKEYNYGKTA